MRYILKHSYSYFNRLTAVITSFLMMGLFFSCASIEPKPQVAESPGSYPEPKIQDVKPAAPQQEAVSQEQAPDENKHLSGTQETEVDIAEEEKEPERDIHFSKDVYFNLIMSSLNTARGNFEEAKDQLAVLIENDPDSIYLNRKMVLLLRRSGDLEGALKHARKCVEIKPDDIMSHLLLADIYSMTGDSGAEKKEYETVLELDPDQQRVRLILATLLIRNRQFEEAMAHLDKLIVQNPDLLIAYYYRGRIYLAKGDYEAAEKEYLHALEKDDSMEPVLFDLASLYQIQKRLEDASGIYEKLLNINPSNRVARERLIGIYNSLGKTGDVQAQIDTIKRQTQPGDPVRQSLGLFYLKNGMLDESISELDLIVTAWPEDYKSRYYLALAYEENGQPEKALEHFRLIKPGNEYFINSQTHIAYILDEMKEYDEAIAVIRNAIEIAKEKTDFYLILASLFEAKKKYDKAIESIEEGLTYDEKNIDLIFRLGVVLDKAGDKDASIMQMRKVLEIDPDHADSMNYIGYTYAERGVNLDEAMELILKALTIKPNSGFIIDSLGWVYYQQGDYDKALDSLEKAFSLISTDPTIAEHLGDVYLKKNEFKKSLEMYKKALSLEHQYTDKILQKIEDVKKYIK